MPPSTASRGPTRRRLGLLAAGLVAAGAPFLAASAAEPVVNLYSSRHYDTDRELYEAFTRETGIRVRLIEANADQLMERIRAEGANSPADLLITVDAGRLARAKELGLLQPTRSAALDSRVPANLRDPEGTWYGISMRARVIMYDKAKGLPAGLARYEDLAKPEFKDTVCSRSSGNIYTIGWAASMLAADGPEATEAWARGVVANFARPPQGGDSDQIRGVAAGQCRFGISNTYYLGLLARSQRAEDRAIAERIGVLFPNQGPGDRGTHVNISGAGVVKTAPNAENARKFLEYLTSAKAQQIFAEGNMEYPVVADVPVSPFLAGLGHFRQDPLNAALFAANGPAALQILQRAGWR